MCADQCIMQRVVKGAPTGDFSSEHGRIVGCGPNGRSKCPSRWFVRLQICWQLLSIEAIVVGNCDCVGLVFACFRGGWVDDESLLHSSSASPSLLNLWTGRLSLQLCLGKSRNRTELTELVVILEKEKANGGVITYKCRRGATSFYARFNKPASWRRRVSPLRCCFFFIFVSPKNPALRWR